MRVTLAKWASWLLSKTIFCRIIERAVNHRSFRSSVQSQNERNWWLWNKDIASVDVILNPWSKISITYNKLFTPLESCLLNIWIVVYFQEYSKSMAQFFPKKKNGRQVLFRLRDQFGWRRQRMDSLRSDQSIKNGKYFIWEEWITILANRTTSRTNNNAPLSTRGKRDPRTIWVLKCLHPIDHPTPAIVLAMDWAQWSSNHWNQLL